MKKKKSNLAVKNLMDPLMLHVTQTEQRHRVESDTYNQCGGKKKERRRI